MEKSEHIDQLGLAMAKFQGELIQPSLNAEVSVKTGGGYSYKFKYADFSECKRAATPLLAKYGLSVLQLIEDGYSVRTVLLHSSGQWIASVAKMNVTGNKPQDFGSAITYAKRYAFCAILGIVADDDEDGNIASGNQAQKQPIQKQQRQANVPTQKPKALKPFNPQWKNEPTYLEWIHKCEMQAKNAGSKFSLVNLIKSFYDVKDLSVLTELEDSYINYKLENNL